MCVLGVEEQVFLLTVGKKRKKKNANKNYRHN